MQQRPTKNGLSGWFILFLFFIFCIFLFLVVAAFFFLPTQGHGNHAHDDDDNSHSHHRHSHHSGGGRGGGGGKGGGSPPPPGGRFIITGGGGEEEKLRFSGGVVAVEETDGYVHGEGYDLVEEVGVLLETSSSEASSLWTVDSIVVDGQVVGYSTSIGGEDDSGLVTRTPGGIGSFPPPISGAVPFCGVYEVSKPHQGISFYGKWPERYVGINTKLPDTQLDVNGDAKVRGNLKVCGDLEVCGDFTLQNRTVFSECDAQQECQHLLPTNGCQLAVCLKEIGGDGAIHCLLKVDANEVGEPCDDGDDFTENDECSASGLCEGDHVHSRKCNATEKLECGPAAQCRQMSCGVLADGYVLCGDRADLTSTAACDDWIDETVEDACHEGVCRGVVRNPCAGNSANAMPRTACDVGDDDCSCLPDFDRCAPSSPCNDDNCVFIEASLGTITTSQYPNDTRCFFVTGEIRNFVVDSLTPTHAERCFIFSDAIIRPADISFFGSFYFITGNNDPEIWVFDNVVTDLSLAVNVSIAGLVGSVLLDIDDNSSGGVNATNVVYVSDSAVSNSNMAFSLVQSVNITGPNYVNLCNGNIGIVTPDEANFDCLSMTKNSRLTFLLTNGTVTEELPTFNHTERIIVDDIANFLLFEPLVDASMTSLEFCDGSRLCTAQEVIDECPTAAQCNKMGCTLLGSGQYHCGDYADLSQDGDECDDWNGESVGDHCHEGSCVAGTAAPTASPTTPSPTPSPTPDVCALESCPNGTNPCTNNGHCFTFGPGLGGACISGTVVISSGCTVFGGQCDMGDCYCQHPDNIGTSMCAPPDPCAEAECPQAGFPCSDALGTCFLPLGPPACTLGSLSIPSDCTVAGEPCDMGCTCNNGLSTLSCSGGGAPTPPPPGQCPAGSSICGLGGIACFAPEICCETIFGFQSCV